MSNEKLTNETPITTYDGKTYPSLNAMLEDCIKNEEYEKCEVIKKFIDENSI